MMPTSLYDRLLAVTTPALKLPPANVPLLRLPLMPPLGNTSVGVSSTASGLDSRPKFGAAVPAEVNAVTVALKASPAFTNLVPVALAAAGFTRLGLAVCRTAVMANPAGLTTKALLLPASAAPLTVLLAHSVTWPTSA